MIRSRSHFAHSGPRYLRTAQLLVGRLLSGRVFRNRAYGTNTLCFSSLTQDASILTFSVAAAGNPKSCVRMTLSFAVQSISSLRCLAHGIQTNVLPISELISCLCESSRNKSLLFMCTPLDIYTRVIAYLTAF
jgi:hypothetical protein